MKFLYGLGGANIPVIREFEIEKTEKFEAGRVVKCSSNGIVSHTATGKVLGIAAEDHSGQKDILNARADGNKLRVDVTLGGVYSVPALRVAATEQTDNEYFKCSSEVLSSNIVDCKLVLVEKAENSSNTDSVGTERKIISVFPDEETMTLYLERGGAPCEGDVYAFVPRTGFDGYVADDGKSFSCTGSMAVSVAGYDKQTNTLEVVFKNKLFN